MKDLKRARCYLASAVTAATLLATTPAWAQDQGQAASPAAKSNNSGVSEIVVTAQRREQSVLDVPLAIQASTAQTLQSQGIKQITDLQFTTPGYNVNDSNGYTMVFIRGIGNAEFVGADPSVATFIDDVPRVYGSMVNNFVDVERVEVLKGAQGGLYGRNATGGVINIITRQPDLEDPHADVKLSYGSHRTIDAEGYVTVPLIKDKVALSISAERKYSDPYFKNTAPSDFYTPAMFSTGILGMTPAQTAALFNSKQNNSNVGNQDFWAVDGKLLIKPSDNFKVTFAGDYSNKNDSQGNAQWENSPAYEQQTFLGTPLAPGLLPIVVGELGGNINYGAFPANFLQGNPKKFTVSNGTPGFVRLNDWGLSGTAVLSTDNIDFTSITAYRKQHTQFIDDLGASTIASTAALVDNHKHFFYQELRAVSHFDGPFQFIAGGSYLNNYTQYYTDVDLFGGVIVSPTARSIDRVKNWSVYAQASYDFTDKLTLTASGRYIHESNTAIFYTPISGGFGPQQGDPASAVEQKFLPSATLSYKLEGGGNVYVRWARGFKSGGVNPVANASAFVVGGTYYPTAGSIFKGETVDTFEGGYKGQFFDNKVQLTADVFYNSYRDLQTAGHVTANYANDIILTIVNAPSARTYGVEGTLAWRLTPSVTFTTGAGYLNARYKDFSLPDVGPVGNPILSAFDLSGHRMPNSPEWQANFGLNVDQPMTNGVNLIANALASYTSSIFWQASGAPCGPGGISGVTCLPDATSGSYWIVNARIGIKSADDRFRLELFANNLFNAAYVTYGNSNAANTTQFTWGNPRIIGVEATMHL